MKTNNSVIINRLTVMPVLPERMVLNSDNQPQVVAIRAVNAPTYTKQVPRVSLGTMTNLVER